MTLIKQFPVIENNLDSCSGCHTDLTGEYWEVQLPTNKGFKNIGLCDRCYADLEKTGVL